VSFASPIWLAALVLVPLAVAAYVLSRARARRYAVRFPAISTLRLAAATVPAWRRHVPAALLLAAATALVLALARPHTTVRVPIGRAAVMLVTDHSGSMVADDVAPTRLGAAQAAAHTFISQLPSQTRVGVIAFSTGVDAVQPPSPDHSLSVATIDSENAGGATDTGDALQLALDELHQNAPHSPSAVVLLSDGAWNTGRDPVAVAQQPTGQRIPIYTVALGTADATIPNPGGFGPPTPVPPDPATLARIAQVSHARAFSAGDADRLTSIYRQLGSQLGSVRRSHEVTWIFATAGLLLLAGAGVASMRFGGRLP
jgi:Ca-activated chloride channel family protein